MKIVLSILCSILLTCCLSTNTFAAGNEHSTVTLEKMETNKKTSTQTLSNKLKNVPKKFFIISGALVTASVATASYCGAEGCQGIAGSAANAAPTMVGIFLTATGLATIL